MWGARLPFLALAAGLAAMPLSATPSTPGTPPDDPALSGDATLELALPRVVHLALGRNPALAGTRERRREVAAAIDEAAARVWPEVTLRSSWSRARSPNLLNSPDFEDIVDQIPGEFTPREQELSDVTVEVNQTLYNGGALGAAVRLAERVRAAAEAQISTAELDLAVEAAVAFHRCQAAEQAQRVVEAQAEARRQALDAVEARYELGEATELERLRARAALAAVAPTSARAVGDLEVARTELRALLDVPTSVRVHCPATVDLASTEPASDTVPPGDADGAASDDVAPLAALMASARGLRPELDDLAEQDLALAAQEAIERAEGRPQVELNGAYGRQARFVDDLTDRRFDNWRVSVDLSWTLFDGGRRRGREAQIASQRTQTRWQRAALGNRIVADVTAAHVAYQTARETWRAARVAATASDEAQRVAAESYDLGVALLTDVLDAQEQSLRAELDAVEARAELAVAHARLARAVGHLPTASLDPASLETLRAPRPDDPMTSAPSAGVTKEEAP